MSNKVFTAKLRSFFEQTSYKLHNSEMITCMYILHTLPPHAVSPQ